jgi:hypothetical protein
MKILSFLFFAVLLPFAFGAALMWTLAETDLLTFLMNDADSFAGIVLCWGLASAIILFSAFVWWEDRRPVKRDAIQYIPLRLVDSSLIWRQEGEEILFIYNIRHNCDSNWFDRRSFSTTTNVKDEWNWVFDSFNRRSDIADWMAGMEKTYDDFFDMPFAGQVAALFDLYGYEQVFGSSYWEGFEIEGYSRED